ncbi:hypothetical protein THAOC_27416 [Thalassiosira oceanica]|uniref:Uncharacterized protein n=1 Tax=Thalassiosira oceanica TaxID=159749 RepID=K0RWM5_THAOC|nr:hypothetical protein THAOC_27416 [Thalassiosira oceanica]|eukprot:EJK53201.1 hypothetical protein THAOC_27416 [Thalassiosira oceanica]
MACTILQNPGCDENRVPPRRHAAGIGHACPHKASEVEMMEHRWWQREVRTMPTSRYDRWAFECCDKISQQVVLAAPNAMGHMNNEEFVLAITRYFGQQNFISRSMEGLYFGKNGDRVDAFGSNLCCASLPGGGFRVLHDQVKTLIITFFRLAGVTANDEDPLWMLGRVPDPYMRRYTDWILRARAEDRKYPDGTIVADFVARDCPTPTQASNDSEVALAGGRDRTSWARRNYRKRTLDLDRAHAPEVVGDGTNGQVGPFEEALLDNSTLATHVFPILAGAFGEVNEDASKLVTNLARLTAKTDFGKSMSPLVTATAGKAVPSQSCSHSSDAP